MEIEYCDIGYDEQPYYNHHHCSQCMPEAERSECRVCSKSICSASARAPIVDCGGCQGDFCSGCINYCSHCGKSMCAVCTEEEELQFCAGGATCHLSHMTCCETDWGECVNCAADVCTGLPHHACSSMGHEGNEVLCEGCALYCELCECTYCAVCENDHAH